MAWERLAHDELTVAGSLDTGTFTAKKKLKIQIWVKNNGAAQLGVRFNNDSGNNYPYRISINGGADSSGGGIDKIVPVSSITSGYTQAAVLYVTNLAAEEKLVISDGFGNSGAGATNAPNRREGVAKWVNTSNQITSVQVVEDSGSGGNFAAGSYITVWGAKEAATSDTLTVDGFTAKKHLMIQAKIIASGTANARLRFNNDTGSNYADRKSSNGGADGTVTSQTSIRIGTGVSANQNQLNTINVINEASNEKLVISESVKSATGAGTAPDRQEEVGKWANTSNQITRVDIINTDSGDFAEGSEVTVYGTD